MNAQGNHPIGLRDPRRFITQDTYKGSPWQPWTQNLYTYVGNNPANLVDPTGHAPEAAGRDGGWSEPWHIIYVSGMSADLQDPLIQDFQAGAAQRGFSSSVADYWSSYPMCEGPCKADVQVSEWTGDKTGLSTDFAKTLGAEIQALQAAGKKVVVVGHSMGGTVVMNAASVLADAGVRPDAILLLGGAVRQEVKDAVAAKGISVTQFNNPLDKVPEWAASRNFLDVFGMAYAGRDAEHHQLPGYFSPTMLPATLNAIGGVRNH